MHDPDHHERDDQTPDELEAMLAGLPTREPSRMLDERIANTLGQENSDAALARDKRSPVWRIAALAAAVAIVGCVAMLIVLRDFPPSPDTNPAFVKPPTQAQGSQPDVPAIVNASAAEPVRLIWSRDVGEQVRYTPAGEPYRAVLREKVDHQAWIDLENGETRQVYIPREELIVVKQSTF